MPTPRLRLGQLLLDAKMISEEALEEVLAFQRADGRRLGILLVERKLINETQLTQILSHQLSIPWVSLLHIEFSRQLLNLVPHYVADRFCVVPIYVRHVRGQGDTLYVAMDDPSNEDGLKACIEHSGLPVRAMIAPPSDIRSAIRAYYGVGPRPPDEEPVAVAVPEYSVPSGPRTDPAPAPAPVAAPAPAPVIEAQPEVPPPAVEVAPVADPDQPEIETVEIPVEPSRAARLRAILAATEDEPPPSERAVESIPQPRGRAPRMVSLTLLDGTTINLPAKRRAREPRPPVVEEPVVAPAPIKSEPPGPDEATGLTARDLVAALRAVSNGADATEVLGTNVRWEAMFAALLSLMLKKHMIADWEFVDELKKL